MFEISTTARNFVYWKMKKTVVWSGYQSSEPTKKKNLLSSPHVQSLRYHEYKVIKATLCKFRLKQIDLYSRQKAKLLSRSETSIRYKTRLEDGAKSVISDLHEIMTTWGKIFTSIWLKKNLLKDIVHLGLKRFISKRCGLILAPELIKWYLKAEPGGVLQFVRKGIVIFQKWKKTAHAFFMVASFSGIYIYLRKY